MDRYSIKPIRLLIYTIALLATLVLARHVTIAQRGLYNWKHDLEVRLAIYQHEREDIQNIIASSINYPGRGAPIAGPVTVSSGGNVRFSELIIPTGSLVLESHIARPTVRILIDKTQSYIDSKLRDVYRLRDQLAELNDRLARESGQYIYKGSKSTAQPQYNHTGLITGVRVFKQVQYANMIDGRSVTVAHINRTDVNRVIDETYLRTSKVTGIQDAQGRLFFEGTKTFTNTVFVKPLRSGCCDRLRPLHTSRMMFRSKEQEVFATIVLQSSSNHTSFGHLPVIIRNLKTDQLSNQVFALGGAPQFPNTLSPVGMNLYSNLDNIIRLPNLIDLHQNDQQKALKTIVFKDAVRIADAQLFNSFNDNRFVIGIGSVGPQAPPASVFDLSHDNYLLKFAANNTGQHFEQLVAGTIVLNSAANFQTGLEAQVVNHIADFARFVNEIIVRVDRPATISGPVQFIAVPAIAYGPPLPGQQQSAPSNLLMLQVQRHLQLGLINGMRWPQDIVVLPSASGPPNSVALKPGQVIYVNGSKRFANQLLLADLLQVSGLVNGMRLPETVIPLHLNDFIGSVGRSDLWFVDGMTVHQLVIQGGRFDDIVLRDVFVDAQSLVMQTVFPRQPDGSILVRAPLRVINLRLFGNGAPNRGLLNGFRARELDLFRYESLHGRKRFMAPVEALNCILGNINDVANWTSQLIRIDRPGAVQTVHSRLAFDSQPSLLGNTSYHGGAVEIDRLNVEFHAGHSAMHYASNWKFSPEFYLMHQALARHEAGHNQTGGRYRCQKIRLARPDALINSIRLDDIVTVDKPFRFGKQFTMVGKVGLVGSSLRANRIQSNYPIDQLDLVQFNNQRIPIFGSRAPISLSNLILTQENKASFVHSQLINGISFVEFANSIMSLTRPQYVESELVFEAPVSFEAPLQTTASLNGIKNFRYFAYRLKNAKYTFEDGLQCNTVVIQ